MTIPYAPTMILESFGSPSGSVVPQYIGQLCLDRSTPNVYQANGFGTSDWVEVGSGGGGGGGPVSLTGAGETATPGLLTQAGGFNINDTEGDGIDFTTTDTFNVTAGESINIEGSTNISIGGTTGVTISDEQTITIFQTGPGGTAIVDTGTAGLTLTASAGPINLTGANGGITLTSSNGIALADNSAAGIQITSSNAGGHLSLTTTLGANIYINAGGVASILLGNDGDTFGMFGSAGHTRIAGAGITTVAELVSALQEYGLLG